MMLVDTGLSAEDAHREASGFFLTTPAAHDPDARDFYGSHPPAWYEAQYPLFRARPLFPRLAALPYPRLGFRALKDVSAAGVVLAAVALYVCCSSSRRRGWPRSERSPPRGRRSCASRDDADDRRHRARVVDDRAGRDRVLRAASDANGARVSLVAAVLLALTRPAIWLPLGAAAGLVVAAYRSGDPYRRGGAVAMLAGQSLVAAGTLISIATVHGAGFATLQRWSYDWQTAIHGPYVGHGVAYGTPPGSRTRWSSNPRACRARGAAVRARGRRRRRARAAPRRDRARARRRRLRRPARDHRQPPGFPARAGAAAHAGRARQAVVAAVAAALRPPAEAGPPAEPSAGFVGSPGQVSAIPNATPYPPSALRPSNYRHSA